MTSILSDSCKTKKRKFLDTIIDSSVAYVKLDTPTELNSDISRMATAGEPLKEMTWLVKLLDSMISENKQCFEALEEHFAESAEKQEEAVKKLQDDLADLKIFVPTLSNGNTEINTRFSKIKNCPNSAVNLNQLDILEMKATSTFEAIYTLTKKLGNYEKSLIKQNIIVKGLPIQPASNLNDNIAKLSESALRIYTKLIECYCVRNANPPLVRIKLDSFDTKLKISQLKKNY